MTESTSRIDFERLLKLRLAVARHGEMDAARWWNTNGILGRRGSMVLKRGFPSTHYYAQARIAFAVARSRCHELFDPPGCMTLWSLPADIEDHQYWSFAKDRGAVAMVERTDVTAMLLYQDHQKHAAVLAQIEDALGQSDLGPAFEAALTRAQR